MIFISKYLGCKNKKIFDSIQLITIFAKILENMRIYRALLILTLAITFASCQKKVQQIDYQVVPLPKEISLTDEAPFVLDSKTIITYPKSQGEILKEATFLADYIEEALGFRPQIKIINNEMKNAINLKINVSQLEKENLYKINITKSNINVFANFSYSNVYDGDFVYEKVIRAIH